MNLLKCLNRHTKPVIINDLVPSMGALSSSHLRNTINLTKLCDNILLPSRQYERFPSHALIPSVPVWFLNRLLFGSISLLCPWVVGQTDLVLLSQITPETFSRLPTFHLLNMKLHRRSSTHLTAQHACQWLIRMTTKSERMPFKSLFFMSPSGLVAIRNFL